jgi:acyl-CoA synthetase (AMP-forming)/AMP-acid ligase II
MAEATLLISGGTRGGRHVTRSISRTALQAHAAETPSDTDDGQIVVGCGRALAGERIAIVEPERRVRLPADRVGEIWVGGANIARAYWRNDEATRDGLNAEIAGEDGPWLRTGDLGFLDVTGELFVTGRIKDLIIVRGINHYPQDIERTVQSLDAALRENCGAAFAVPNESGEETLVIVQEVERTARRTIDAEEIKGQIREAIADNHELSTRHITLIRPGALPKTTSGKIQRKLARRLWLDGSLEEIG